MPNYRCQVTFPMFSLVPTDVMTNTFHFFTLTPTTLDEVADDVTPKLATFYSNIYLGGRSMGNYMVPSSATVNWYDLGTPPPRVPDIRPLGATIPVTSTVVPTEVTCCLSFQGSRVPGVPQSRRRGRIYIPALNDVWITTSTTSQFPSFTSGTRNALTAAANALRTSVAAGPARWAVWSPTDQVMTEVLNGWVDNTPDTQRRRGVEGANRTIWP